MDFNLPGTPTPGYSITINEDGLSKLMLNGFMLGEGSVGLVDGGWFYGTTPFGAGHTATISSKNVAYQSNGATVTHTYTGLLSATVVYTYVVSDNDIHITAHVTNTHATKTLHPAFRSMRFQRGTGGTYIGFNYDQSHTQNAGERLSYPSFEVPLSASVMNVPSIAGPMINTATWSEEHPSEKFMSVLSGVFPLPGAYIVSIFFNKVPPGGSRIYKYAIRFQNSSDWKDLLLGYKTHLRAAFPNLAYEPDARPLAYFTAIHPSYIRPDNPYGYGDSGTNVFRRFDKLEGCQDYVAKLTGPMADTNYQGIVMWQPQGIHTRGVQYRPDFNSFPTVTIPNLPTLVNGFRNAGLNIGLLSRPSLAAVSGNNWDTDGGMRLASSDGVIEDIGFRLAWATNLGFNSFYLDSFVSLETDIGILNAIRKKVGPNVHLFIEHSNALTMPQAAMYAEVGWSGGVIVLTQHQQILRWLYPESIVAAHIGQQPAGEYATMYPAMFDLKLTPWVEDYRAISVAAGSENAILKPLVASHIGPNRRWL